MQTTEYSHNIPDYVHQFVQELRNNAPVRVEAVYLVGSVLTPDFQPAVSDLNTLILLPDEHRSFLDFLIGLGRRFRDRRLAPPLVMSEEYIYRSLDVFPVEFLNFREIHHVLFGPDILADLVIEFEPLRMQCERELKARLLWLRQVYLETLAREDLLAPRLVDSMTGYFPLMRALLVLAGQKPPLGEMDLITRVQDLVGLGDDIFVRLRTMKRQQAKWPNQEALLADYTRLNQAVRKIAYYVDALAD